MLGLMRIIRWRTRMTENQSLKSTTLVDLKVCSNSPHCRWTNNATALGWFTNLCFAFTGA